MDNLLIAEVVTAIRRGDLERLQSLLSMSPQLVNAYVDGQRTLLHVATDWPGHFPNNPETVELLIRSGADVNARFVGSHSETPLHWAVSSNDVAVAEVLLEHGAEIEATGGVIANGTPMADAVAFGQWACARKLLDRGAATNLWQAAGLGLLERVAGYFRGASDPSHAEITHAFWCACHGGQRTTAEYLLSKGADPDQIGHDGLTPLRAAQRSGATDLIDWLQTRA